MEGTFNAELLRLARHYRGISQKDFASDLSVKASTISRFENGIVIPSLSTLEAAAKRLALPVGFFFQPDHVYGLPISVHPMFRKKAAVRQREIDRTLAELNIRIIHLRRLIDSVDYEPIEEIPALDIESYDGGAEEIALLLRRQWRVPYGPIANLTELIERAGCFVIPVDLPDSAMDGVTLRTPNAPPCIFLNKNQSSDRMRLTLAHELGHLVMHRIPTEDLEKEANAFASALLMPAVEVGAHFNGRRIDLPLLASLKKEWRVSMAALLYRAQTLEFVDKSQARYLWQQFSIHRIRLREPPETDFPSELPVLMPKLLSVHLNDLGFTLSDLGHLFRMYDPEVRALYGLDPENVPPAPRKLHLAS